MMSLTRENFQRAISEARKNDDVQIAKQFVHNLKTNCECVHLLTQNKM